MLVNETGMGRVHRLWISGDKAGQQDIFVDELPGTPTTFALMVSIPSGLPCPHCGPVLIAGWITPPACTAVIPAGSIA
ncbi:MAG: hypothetical protein CM15mP74_16180 [Halieaceae bacterium]|nr:MAG: hypothetical protein CM15mP74_16180 [Halieaceae bacterium]